MKRKGCFVLFGVCSALLFMNGVCTEASGISESEGKWITFEADETYRIQFQEGTEIFSKSGENNLKVLDEIIKMVQCKIQIEAQEFTVGVEFAENGYTEKRA